MRFFLPFFIFLACIACTQKKTTQNPLSGFERFHVSFIPSPYKSYKEEFLLKELVRNLEKYGTLDTTGEIPANTPALLLFIGDGGSIQVVSDVNVTQNGYQTACSIWSAEYTANASFPYEHEGKIQFKKSTESTDLQQEIQYLVSQFADAYEKGNPKNPKPILYFAHP